MLLTLIQKILIHFIQHYNHEKYWKMRKVVLERKANLFLRYYYLYQIKRMDAFNGSSTGIDLNWGAHFKTPPNLPHGLRGIFIHNNTYIGSNCTIYHHVTIGERRQMDDPKKEKAPIIGDNVMIGAGAKILGDIKIGNNVKIGANCVVVEDVPDDSIVVLQKPRLIVRKYEQ